MTMLLITLLKETRQTLGMLIKMKKNILNIDILKKYISANPLPEEKPIFPELNKPLNQVKAEVYQQLLDNLIFSDYTNAAIEELKGILNFDKSLEQKKVKKWTNKNLDFFLENVFLFGINYCDVELNECENIFLRRVDEYVDKMPFISIIQFWECMSILYFEQYHLDKDKKSPPDPVGSYYYTPPDPNEPTDIEKILNYLKLS